MMQKGMHMKKVYMKKKPCSIQMFLSPDNAHLDWIHGYVCWIGWMGLYDGLDGWVCMLV